jgi:membrane carboxypeptidase/penicillin-binding protein PbpC
VLSDEPARWPAYGPTNLLEIGRPTAVMVGKTGDHQDNWTVGYTPSRVVGAWVGNTTSEEMVGIQDLNGAAPIWHAVIRYAIRNLPSEAWPLPGGVVEMDVCDPSGLLPTEYCPVVVNEVFLQGTEPNHSDNLFRPFLVNRETGKLATLATPIDLVEERVYMVPPPEAIPWAQQSQIDQPPDEYDTIYDRVAQDPTVQIISPRSFEVLQGEVRISGVAGGEGFEYYRLQYGQGLNPSSWVQIGADVAEPRSEEQLGRWDTAGLNGLYTLQLVVVRESGQVSTNEVFMTLDNQPPSLEILTPKDGQEITLVPDGEWIIEVRASDSTAVAQVQFFVDGELLATITTPPYAYHWVPDGMGEFEIEVSAFDKAGNRATTQPVTVQVVH